MNVSDDLISNIISDIAQGLKFFVVILNKFFVIIIQSTTIRNRVYKEATRASGFLSRFWCTEVSLNPSFYSSPHQRLPFFVFKKFTYILLYSVIMLYVYKNSNT